MIPSENKFFLYLALLIIIILGLGYWILGGEDDDREIRIPHQGPPVELLKPKISSKDE